jgi:hypothetical protein
MADRGLGPNGEIFRGALGAVLVVAGGIHLALTPEHLGESVVLGIGFLTAGVLQLVLAVWIFRRVSRLALLLVGVSSTALIVAYGVAVAVGLPFVAADAMDEGLSIGTGEPVTLVAAVAKVAELASILLAMALISQLNAGERARPLLGVRKRSHQPQ